MTELRTELPDAGAAKITLIAHPCHGIARGGPVQVPETGHSNRANVPKLNPAILCAPVLCLTCGQVWTYVRDDICLYLSPVDRAELQALVADRNTPRKLVWRAEIVLATAGVHGTFEIMRRAKTSKPTVWRWQARYLDDGVAGLKRDKTRPSRVPPLPRETRLKVIAKTVQESPPNATHWSRSSMAEAVGISPSSVGRIWAEAGLMPHLSKGFKVSNDPMFEGKVTDIVGFYLDPPERAVVLCVDEKSQIQALDRTQPGLPLKKGRAATMTHD